jgi:hypothetical protein
MKKWLQQYLDDLFFLTGAILVVIGAYKVLPVLAWFVSGFFCLLAGYIVARAKGSYAAGERPETT